MSISIGFGRHWSATRRLGPDFADQIPWTGAELPTRRSLGRLEGPWQVCRVPSRARQTWNDEDVATLRRMAGQGQPLAEIARVLGRSRMAVQGRAAQLKIRVRDRREA
ncbi:MAG: hypothetical protein JOY99_12970 [Sphingomonadaceae bacterium]|nr:hypothetical protein [Sphingomonadaceae bacterium]